MVPRMWAVLTLLQYVKAENQIVVSVTATKDALDHNQRLYVKLFTGYEKSLSPYTISRLPNVQLPVNQFVFGLEYARILKIYDTEYLHESVLAIVFKWNDPRLTWDPSEYGGIDEMYVARDNLWMPEFLPCKAASAESLMKDKHQIAEIYHDGNIQTMLVLQMKFSCQFRNFFFPFDMHQCHYCFLSGYRPSELAISGFITQNATIQDNSEWSFHVAGVSCVSSEDLQQSFLFFHTTMTRRPNFWIYLVLLPVLLISTLVPIGLFFSGDSHVVQNSVSLGLTSMTSMMVVVAVLADFLAKSADVPVLGWVVFIEIIVSSLSVPTILICYRIRKAYQQSERFCWRESKEFPEPTRMQALSSTICSKSFINISLFVFFSLFRLVNLLLQLQHYGEELELIGRSSNVSLYQNCTIPEQFQQRRFMTG